MHECSESAQTSTRPSLTSWFDTIFSRLELGAGCVRGASGRAERQYRTAGPVCSHLSACRLHSIAHARPFVPVECNPEEKAPATSLAAHICPEFGVPPGLTPFSTTRLRLEHAGFHCSHLTNKVKCGAGLKRLLGRAMSAWHSLAAEGAQQLHMAGR